MILYDNKKQYLDTIIDKLNNSLINKCNILRHRLEIVESNHILKNPELLYKNKKIDLKNLIDKLELVNPMNVIKRGYSLTYINDKVVKSVKNINKKDNINIKLSDGSISATIIDIKEN